MDQSSIERALTSLIPAHDGPLPSKLVELATSLLAQSRSKAGNLKAEEEIARVYVCAHLACERLKQSLNLPKIDSRPPCPPRVYKKLYNYLDQVLPATSQRSRQQLRATPPLKTWSTKPAGKSTGATVKPRHDHTLASKSQRTGSDASNKTGSQSITTASAKPTSSLAATPSNDSNQEWDAPASVQPLLDHLCTHVFRPQAMAYVLRGLRAVMTLPAPPAAGDKAATSSEHKKMPALLIALCVYVTTRLSGVPLDVKTLDTQREAAMAVLALPEFVDVSVEKARPGDVDDWMWKLHEGAWMNLDWFKKIPLGDDPALLAREISGADERFGFNDEMDVDDVVMTTVNGMRMSSPSSARKGTTPLGGLGTMIQSKVDYLSEQKRAEYLEWRERIGKRVAEIERARGGKDSTDGSSSFRMPISTS